MRNINFRRIKFRLRELFESPGILALIIVMIPIFISLVIRSKEYNDVGISRASNYILEKLRENNMRLFEILYITVIVPFTVLFWVGVVSLFI